LDGQKAYQHRVIWKMEHGTDPEIIDHINGNPRDNRLENLRSVSHRVNIQNSNLSKANTSGVKGVSTHRIVGFNASIHDETGKNRRKWFKHFDDAVQWRRDREVEFGYIARAS
jgi:hypothetical protein